MKKFIFPSFLIYKNMNSLILKINILTTELKCFPNHNLRSIVFGKFFKNSLHALCFNGTKFVHKM